ncbi:UDP-N-acetylmuramoyl-tripeptide--D-alanyl-D-alanine ligase [Paenibacillus assamensis]|uniref:UDP-N-acetylmuramoyl-tripeptide--D-alanyl-D- alanine ligase n=1 Tax=Paenibacillus assamensis TaxID=311244 RepID=UPI0003FC77D5|nr:UDP-N-acetylmuramoyl-tripeptide--D-alanyl-D-alanine ligase [Paenibacillus assamensis]
MNERSLAAIAAMCGGELVHPTHAAIAVNGVYTDSRQTKLGALFVPLSGERFDGHVYVEQAIQDGAAAALWQNDHPQPNADLPLILVEDTLAALQQLAQSYIQELPVQIVAVTGSNGKTTTKDLVASVLSARYRVHKTEGNFNNHIGLPLTVLNMAEDTQIAVLEMGMSGRGEIELLTKLVKPHVTIVTNVGDAHLLQLGSRKEIARAKMEIISGLREGGLFICHGDEPLITEVLEEPATVQPASMKTVKFGLHAYCDYKPDAIMQSEEGISFTLSSEAFGPMMYRLPILGQHNVMNALAAIAVAQHFGVPQPLIAEGLERARISGMRIEKTVTRDGWTLLNDAYNASPTATKAALQVLAAMPKDDTAKRIAILGDMLELGETEEQLHYEVGTAITPEMADVVLTYGRLGRAIAEGAATQLSADAVQAFDSKDELQHYFAAIVKEGDVVLLKASRGMKLEEVVKDWIHAQH